MASQEMIDQLTEQPPGATGQPEDIADAILLLLSKEATG